MKKGVVYVAWGEKVQAELKRSIESLPEGLAYTVIEPENPSGHAAKTCMYEQSPYDITCFLDTDTLVLGDINGGFEAAEKFELACCIAPASDANIHWKLNEPGLLLEYNTGVLFFKKCPRISKLFMNWTEIATKLNLAYDQPSFALSVKRLELHPFVLPPEYNYRPGLHGNRWFGPMRVWHGRDPVPHNILRSNHEIQGFVTYSSELKECKNDNLHTNNLLFDNLFGVALPPTHYNPPNDKFFAIYRYVLNTLDVRKVIEFGEVSQGEYSSPLVEQVVVYPATNYQVAQKATLSRVTIRPNHKDEILQVDLDADFYMIDLPNSGNYIQAIYDSSTNDDHVLLLTNAQYQNIHSALSVYPYVKFLDWGVALASKNIKILSLQRANVPVVQQKDDDIIWLSSWPRSGNTMLRSILWQCFHLKSASVYPKDLGDDDLLNNNVGHIEMTENGEFPFPEEQKTHLIKTHELDQGSGKAIYVIRNFRPACVSFWEFYKRTIPLIEVVRGNHRFGSWGDHLKSWRPWERENCLLIEYEKMVKDVPGTVKLLSSFLGVEPKQHHIERRSKMSDGQWIRKKTEWRDYWTDELEMEFRLCNPMWQLYR